MFDIDWTSLVLPFAYVLVLVGSLYTFSTVYRKRKACTYIPGALFQYSRVAGRQGGRAAGRQADKIKFQDRE